jgi:hypothetical protein
MGASYGSLLASCCMAATVHLVCLPAEADQRQGFACGCRSGAARIRSRSIRKLPGKVSAGGWRA